MIKYSVKNVHDQKIDQWIKLGLNVCLIGVHGTGKTQRVIEGFKRNSLKYAYFSGSTIDPWLHLIGVPEIEGEAGNRKLSFILPQNIDENIDAIFIDEYNRAPKIVRNALLELQQFKTINGRTFPKLRLVWAAINPPQEDDDDTMFKYDVDEPDPAQLDRFHVLVNIPPVPDPKYFKKVFGNHTGGILVEWWKAQPKQAKAEIAPRRLEYVGNLFPKGVDLSDILPIGCNIPDLVERLSVKEEDVILEKIKSNPDSAEAKEFLKDPQNFIVNRDELQHKIFFPAYKHLPEEILASEVAQNKPFRNYIVALSIAKGPNHWSNGVVKVVGIQDIKDAAATVIDKNWIDDFSSGPNRLFVEASSIGVPVSQSEGREDDVYQEFKDIIATNKYPVPDEYSIKILNTLPSSSFSDTYWHKKALYILRGCYQLAGPILSMNIILAMHHSMQKSTLTQTHGFEKIFNRIVIESFINLSPSDRQRAGALHGNLAVKLPSHKKLHKFMEQAKPDPEATGILPEDVIEAIETAIDLVEK